MIAANKTVGIRLSVICRTTKDEAISAADQLVASNTVFEMASNREHRFISASDSYGIHQTFNNASAAGSSWLSEDLWNGAVKSHGASAIALVGTPSTIAAAIRQYQAIGVSQFIFSGWPQYEEMSVFGQQVLPLLAEEIPNSVAINQSE